MEQDPRATARTARAGAAAARTASTRTINSNSPRGRAQARARARVAARVAARAADAAPGAAAAAVRVVAATAEPWPAAAILENTTTVVRCGAPSQRGTKILIIAFVAKDFSRFSLLVDRLRREQGVDLVPAATGAAGLAQLKGRAVDLVIVDEQLDDMSGIEFVHQFVKVNPLANTAIVGSLPEAEFHEATEGLGVLMQLPPRPQEADAESLLAVLAKISGLIPTGPQEAGR